MVIGHPRRRVYTKVEGCTPIGYTKIDGCTPIGVHAENCIYNPKSILFNKIHTSISLCADMQLISGSIFHVSSKKACVNL